MTKGKKKKKRKRKKRRESTVDRYNSLDWEGVGRAGGVQTLRNTKANLSIAVWNSTDRELRIFR